MSNNTPRIGVFYDGSFLLHASNYYNYIHPKKRRLSIGGLHEFICYRVAEEMGIDYKWCYITQAHYFRGRLSASDAAARGSQLYHDRVFDDILMSEGVQTHYLPLRNIYGRKEERGTDVWLSLEVLELALRQEIDVAVLVVADTDYVPLMRKLIKLGIKVMLIGWELEYINDEGVRIVTKTSHDLKNLAHFPVPMHEVIECGLEQDNELIINLFVSQDSRYSENTAADNDNELCCNTNQESSIYALPGERLRSQVLNLKNGYGFIKFPNNNLFFHSLDLVDCEFMDFAPGDEVEFTIAKNEQGQDVAKSVMRISVTKDEFIFEV